MPVGVCLRLCLCLRSGRGEGGREQIIDYDEGTFQDFTGHADAVTSLRFSPSGQALLSAAGTDIFQWHVCV